VNAKSNEILNQTYPLAQRLKNLVFEHKKSISGTANHSIFRIPGKNPKEP